MARESETDESEMKTREFAVTCRKALWLKVTGQLGPQPIGWRQSRGRAQKRYTARTTTVQETAVHDSLTSDCSASTHIGWYFANRDGVLCQNCVRYPLKPRSNTVIYGDSLMHIVVAGSR